MTKVPGVVKVDRYERVEDDDQYPTFLGVVQIESEDAIEAMNKSDAMAELAGLMLEQAPKWDMRVRWAVHYKRFFTTDSS